MFSTMPSVHKNVNLKPTPHTAFPILQTVTLALYPVSMPLRTLGLSQWTVIASSILSVTPALAGFSGASAEGKQKVICFIYEFVTWGKSFLPDVQIKWDFHSKILLAAKANFIELCLIS